MSLSPYSERENLRKEAKIVNREGHMRPTCFDDFKAGKMVEEYKITRKQLDGLYKRLALYIESQELSKALVVCDKLSRIIAERREVGNHVLKTISKLRCACLIKIGEFGTARKVAEDFRCKDGGLEVELAICLCRDGEFRRALEVMDVIEDDSVATRLLRAQILYGIGDFAEAGKLLELVRLESPKRLQNDDDIVSKCLAIQTVSDSMKGMDWVGTLIGNESLVEVFRQCCYSFAFYMNVTCSLMSRGDYYGAAYLLSALKSSDKFGKVFTDYEILCLEVQRNTALQCQSGTSAAVLELIYQFYVETLRSNKFNGRNADEYLYSTMANNMIALKSSREALDLFGRVNNRLERRKCVTGRYLPSSTRNLSFNRLIFLQKMKRFSECRALLKNHMRAYPDDFRAELVQVALFLREKKKNKAKALLSQMLDTSDKHKQSSNASIALVALSQLESADRSYPDSVEFLLSEARKHRISLDPYLVCSIIDMYSKNGDGDKAIAFSANCLSTARESRSPHALKIALNHGLLLFSQGNVSEASQVFKSLQSADVDKKNESLISQAYAYESLAIIYEGKDSIEIALQRAFPLKYHLCADAKYLVNEFIQKQDSSNDADFDKDKQKSPEGIKNSKSARIAERKAERKRKRRLKRKERHLSKLHQIHGEQFDPTKKEFLPQPNRWLNKNERVSAATRKKTGIKFSGGQGVSVSLHAGRLDARQRDIQSKNQKA